MRPISQPTSAETPIMATPAPLMSAISERCVARFDMESGPEGDTRRDTRMFTVTRSRACREF
jgi:hypothetical protein